MVEQRVVNKLSGTHSFTHSLTYSLTSLVSGSFVLELDRNKTHNIALQWKKVGTRISKWMISENNVGGIGHSLSAIANNENLW